MGIGPIRGFENWDLGNIARGLCFIYSGSSVVRRLHYSTNMIAQRVCGIIIVIVRTNFT